MPQFIDKIEQPTKCPVCHKYQVFRIGQSILKRLPNGLMYSINECSNIDCSYPIIFFFDKIVTHSDMRHKFSYAVPGEIEYKEFNNHILEISKDFVRIYNQGELAESKGLIDGAGMLYRKSLEFLLKDYLIQSTTDGKEIDKIAKLFLSEVIKNYYKDYSRIYQASQFTSWIGNDYTHYQNKNGLELDDIKNLIDIIVVEFTNIKQLQSYGERLQKPS